MQHSCSECKADEDSPRAGGSSPCAGCAHTEGCVDEDAAVISMPVAASCPGCGGYSESISWELAAELSRDDARISEALSRIESKKVDLYKCDNKGCCVAIFTAH